MAGKRKLSIFLVVVFFIAFTCMKSASSNDAEEERPDFEIIRKDGELDEPNDYLDVDDQYSDLDDELLGGSSSITGEQEEEQEEEEEEDDDDGDEIDPAGDEDVIALNATNFHEAIKSNSKVLVEFYAPWDQFSKGLVPEYKKAAAVLRKQGVVVTKVDAIKESSLADEIGVFIFPSFHLYINGIPRKGLELLTSEAIVEWALKKLDTGVVTIESKSEAEAVLAAKDTVSFGYFDKLEGPEFDAYSDAAAVDGIHYVQSTSPEVASVFNVDPSAKKPSLAVLKKSEIKFLPYGGNFSRADLAAFFDDSKNPIVLPFNEETANAVFESPIKLQLLLLADDSHYREIIPVFEKVAVEMQGKMLFVHVNLSNAETNENVVEFFSAKLSEPWIVGFRNTGQGTKYKMNSPITESNIRAFANDVLGGELSPFYKSQDPPQNNDGPVIDVVGSSFEKIVLDESKDVLLEVYASWCKHCQSLAPIYEKLGELFQPVESAVIARIDGTKNEHLGLKYEGFPTILFFAAGEKKAPIESKARKLVSLVRFLKKNAKIPFVLPDRDDDDDDDVDELVADKAASQPATGASSGAKDEL